MDEYFHVTADYCHLEGSKNWSATIHTYVRNGDSRQDVRYLGSGPITFHDLHEIASVMRAIYKEVAIEVCGVQLELSF
jgi:hypothetical protein